MGTQTHSRSQNFSNSQTISKLWNRGQAPQVNPETLPILPIGALEPTIQSISPNNVAQQAEFDSELNLLKTQLLQARRSAILARSQSMELAKRQVLCREAIGAFDQADAALRNLRRLALRLGVEGRRRVRALEGATEWRAIRHTIQRSAELNHIQLAFAA